ncbi:prepilin peptidase [Castellaniella hirudinis]|uniref:A24 family peptidase n=1 Tax=Castellaniella hirudinis TaxID=1144617 RepID=UPI0039C19253
MHWLVVVILVSAVMILLGLGLSDLKHRLLPNRWVAAYALLFPLFAASASLGFSLFFWHVLLGALAFFVFFLLFMTGVMGGGDVKLGTAVFLWAGPHLALPVLLITAWLGGALGIVGWLADRRCLARRMPAQHGLFSGMLRWVSARRGVPYGVGLAAGGLFASWSFYLYWAARLI